jgi:hypothetical protein
MVLVNSVDGWHDGSWLCFGITGHAHWQPVNSFVPIDQALGITERFVVSGLIYSSTSRFVALGWVGGLGQQPLEPHANFEGIGRGGRRAFSARIAI